MCLLIVVVTFKTFTFIVVAVGLFEYRQKPLMTLRSIVRFMHTCMQ
jgi:hypothetical protein